MNPSKEFVFSNFMLSTGRIVSYDQIIIAYEIEHPNISSLSDEDIRVWIKSKIRKGALRVATSEDIKIKNREQFERIKARIQSRRERQNLF